MAARRKTTRPKDLPTPPVLEWITASLGLLIVGAAFGLTLIQALNGTNRPPDLSLTAGEARRTPAGWVIEVKASNRGDETAAGVLVEGRLGAETATAELDYVPALGEARASLRFDGDPRRELELAVLGWSEP